MTPRTLGIFTDHRGLPIDAVTSTLVVYGGKGMGKSNLLSVVVEEMSKGGLRWCALDPVGVLWGLRHSVDGKGPGIECLILGGPHGDIPTQPTAGAVVADLVVDEDVNVIVDISRDASGKMWTKGQRITFLTDFALRLFQRQGELVDGRRREPLFVALDEAARYIPQIIPAGDKDLPRCLGAWEQIAEEGRNIGLGVGFFTQRSARMNKSVSELADAMFAFRIVGPRSLDAVLDWLGDHVPKERVKGFVETIRALDVGKALVVSPGWLRFEDVAQVRPRETFDSSATPKAGERPRRVSGKAARPVDLGKYLERMAETIERAEAEDPKKLQRRVRELQGEIEKLSAEVERARSEAGVEQVEVPVEVEVEIEVPVLDEEALLVLKEATSHFDRSAQMVEQLVDDGKGVAAAAVGVLDQAKQRLTAHRTREPAARREARPAPRKLPEPSAGRAGAITGRGASLPRAPRPDPPVDGEFTPSKSQQKILDALAWFEAMGLPEPAREALAPMADTRPTSGGFKNNLGALRSAGLVDYPSGGTVSLTEAGRAIATPSDKELTNEGLQEAVLARVTRSQAAILEVLIAEYPGSLDRETLADRVGVPITSGGFKNNLGGLRTLGLIDYPSAGFVIAEPVLFPEDR